VGRIAPHYYLHDVVVPRTRLAETLTGFYDIGSRHDLAVTCIAHAGDGNLHPHLHFDAREPGVLERVLAASEEVVRLAVDLGGTLSGEHGIGLEARLPAARPVRRGSRSGGVSGAFGAGDGPKGLPRTRCAEVPTAGVVAAGARRARGSVKPIHPPRRTSSRRSRRDASALRLLVVGGRHHADKGNACEVDGELWTTS
jgi:hypothetical protein